MSWEEFEVIEKWVRKRMLEVGYSRHFNLKILKDVEFSSEHAFYAGEVLRCYTKVDEGEIGTAHLLVTDRVGKRGVERFAPSLKFKETLPTGWKNCVKII